MRTPAGLGLIGMLNQSRSRRICQSLRQRRTWDENFSIQNGWKKYSMNYPTENSSKNSAMKNQEVCVFFALIHSGTSMVRAPFDFSSKRLCFFGHGPKRGSLSPMLDFARNLSKTMRCEGSKNEGFLSSGNCLSPIRLICFWVWQVFLKLTNCRVINVPLVNLGYLHFHRLAVRWSFVPRFFLKKEASN